MKDVLVMYGIGRTKALKHSDGSRSALSSKDYMVQFVIKDLTSDHADAIYRAFNGATPNHKVHIVDAGKYTIGQVINFYL